MTAEQLVAKVSRILHGRSVCVTTNVWHMPHLNGYGVNHTDYRLSIQPGLDGSRCQGWDGDSIQGCGEKIMEAVQREFERAEEEVNENPPNDSKSEYAGQMMN
jgi:hypothetical protein